MAGNRKQLGTDGLDNRFKAIEDRLDRIEQRLDVPPEDPRISAFKAAGGTPPSIVPKDTPYG